MVNSIYQMPRFDADNTSRHGYAAVTIEAVDILVRLLSPIVPHVTHALWQKVGAGSAEAVIDAAWPQPDPAALVRDAIEYVVQVNGKLRGRVSVPAAAGQDEVRAQALADEQVQRHVAGKDVKKVIVVPGKLVNIVVGG
jgi:leucyl-tRNA synthetase